MSASNSITQIGNLVADPVLRYTSAGKAVANGRIAVTDRINVGGDWQDKTSFVNIVVWGPQAENFVGSTGKGTRVVVTGRLDIRSYTPDGGAPEDRQFVTEITCNHVALSLQFAQGQVFDTNKAEVPA